MKNIMGEVENKDSVPVWEKYILTISEASEYFNLGEKENQISGR